MNEMMNEMQKDLLKEYVNVFIGQAANLLSEMANQRVLLSVSEIDLVNMSHEKDSDDKALFSQGYIVSSSMKFGHEFSGRAMLIFPAHKAKLLVDVCMGLETPDLTKDKNEEKNIEEQTVEQIIEKQVLEQLAIDEQAEEQFETTTTEQLDEVELQDTDFDVLKEISNVILNSVVGEFGNLLGTNVEFAIPKVELVFVSNDEQILFLKNNVYMLMLHTRFMLAEDEVEGVIVIALGMNSLNKLLSKIDEVLGDIS